MADVIEFLKKQAAKETYWSRNENAYMLLKAAERLERSAWVDVNDRVPPEGKRVLVKLRDIVGTLDMDTDRTFQGKWVRWRGNVTHWMELPEPPKEG